MTQPIDPSEAETAALMDELERSIPPMNTPDAERLLRDAKRIFDGQGVVFTHQVEHGVWGEGIQAIADDQRLQARLCPQTW